jgi:hypothetical protein
MARSCPSCGYGPIGAFTDNCPMCAEPIRYARGGRVGGGSGPSTIVRWVLIGLVVAAVGMGACCAVGMWLWGTAIEDLQEDFKRAQAMAEAERKARTVVVTAHQLLKEFQENSAEADRKYRGKYLELTGVVERTGGGDEAPFVIVHAGDESATIKLECFFDLPDEIAEIELGRLEKGQSVTLRGEYGGRVSHIQLRQCVLVKKEANTGPMK